jgi:hypothetical protein
MEWTTSHDRLLLPHRHWTLHSHRCFPLRG